MEKTWLFYYLMKHVDCNHNIRVHIQYNRWVFWFIVTGVVQNHIIHVKAIVWYLQHITMVSCKILVKCCVSLVNCNKNCKSLIHFLRPCLNNKTLRCFNWVQIFLYKLIFFIFIWYFIIYITACWKALWTWCFSTGFLYKTQTSLHASCSGLNCCNKAWNSKVISVNKYTEW